MPESKLFAKIPYDSRLKLTERELGFVNHLNFFSEVFFLIMKFESQSSIVQFSFNFIGKISEIFKVCGKDENVSVTMSLTHFMPLAFV